MSQHRLLQFTGPLLVLEGLLCLGLLVAIPADPGNALLFGFSAARLAMLAAILVFTLAALAYSLSNWQQGALARRMTGWLERMEASRPAFAAALLLAAAGLLVLLHREIAPAGYQAVVERVLPLALFVFLIGTHLMVLLFVAGDRAWKGRAALAVLTPVLLIFYWDAATYFSGLNHDWKNSDQGNFLSFALEARSSGYRFTGGRNFMPVYPFLLSVFLDGSRAFFELFATAKLVNIALSLVLLAAMFFIFQKHLSRLESYLLTLVLAFSLYLYKAPYAQPEILFYFLFFVAFYLACRLLLQPSWPLAIGLGLVLAAAQLTKASMLPFVALLLVALAGLALTAWRQGEHSTLVAPRTYLLSLAGVLLVFLAAQWPYISESKQRYGQYFYNVNTTFYAWYDSWEEAVAGTRAHGDGIGWPDLPADQIPSPARYLSSHSAGEIAARLWRGVQQQTGNLWNTFNLLSFPILLAAMVGLAAALGGRGRELWQRDWPVISFSLLLWGGYLLAYAWYAPIAEFADQRFTYSLVIPILFAGFVAIKRLLDEDWQRRAFGLITLVLAADILLWAPVALASFAWYGK